MLPKSVSVDYQILNNNTTDNNSNFVLKVKYMPGTDLNACLLVSWFFVG